MTYSPAIEHSMRMFHDSLSEKDRRRYAAIEATKAQNADAGQRAQEALANTQSARSGLQALATTNSTIAWTAPRL